MKKLFITSTLCFVCNFIFAQWSNTGNNQTTGNLTVGGTADIGELNMLSNDGQTRFYIQKPTATGEPFRILLGYANIDGGIMLGRTDWISKVLVPWRLGVNTTTPQKLFEVKTGVDNYVSFGESLATGNYSGIHFGYLEASNSLYRKSALVFERMNDGAARGKIHILNNGAASSASATLADSKVTVDYNGNVGIGNTSPGEKIQVGTEGFMNVKVGRWAALGETGSALATIIGNNAKASTTANTNMEIITSTVDGAKAIKMQYNEGITFHTFLGSVTSGNSFLSERMRIDNNGNVGIATTSPQAPLQVNSVRPVIIKNNGGNGVYGSEIGFNSILDTQSVPNKFKKLGGTSQNGGASIAVDYSGNMLFQMFDGATTNEVITNYSPQVAFFSNGSVGIGTTSTGSMKLAVEGKIGCREVNVTLNSWPDYVFEPEYKLPSLSELEQYIKANKHLPEVPSASEVKENGLSVGEMNAILLKKVEELTLHLIEQNKKNEKLQSDNDALKNEMEIRLKQLEERLSKVKARN